MPYREPVVHTHDQLNFIGPERAYTRTAMNLPVPVNMFLPPVQPYVNQQHLPPGGFLSLCWPALPTQQHLPPGGLLSLCWPALPTQQHLPPGGLLSLCWPALPTQQHLPPGGLLSPLSINQPFLNSDICLQVGVCLCWPALPSWQHLPPGGCLLTSPSFLATPASRWVFVDQPFLPSNTCLQVGVCWPALPTQQHLPPGRLLSVCQFFCHTPPPRLSAPPPRPIHYRGRKTLCWPLITVDPLFHRFRPAEGHARQQLEPEPPPEAATLQQAAAACPAQLWSLPAQPGKGAGSWWCKSLLPGAFTALLGHWDFKQTQNNKRWIAFWQLSFVSFFNCKRHTVHDAVQTENRARYLHGQLPIWRSSDGEVVLAEGSPLPGRMNFSEYYVPFF